MINVRVSLSLHGVDIPLEYATRWQEMTFKEILNVQDVEVRRALLYARKLETLLEDEYKVSEDEVGALYDLPETGLVLTYVCPSSGRKYAVPAADWIEAELIHKPKAQRGARWPQPLCKRCSALWGFRTYPSEKTPQSPLVFCYSCLTQEDLQWVWDPEFMPNVET